MAEDRRVGRRPREEPIRVEVGTPDISELIGRLDRLSREAENLRRRLVSVQEGFSRAVSGFEGGVVVMRAALTEATRNISRALGAGLPVAPVRLARVEFGKHVGIAGVRVGLEAGRVAETRRELEVFGKHITIAGREVGRGMRDFSNSLFRASGSLMRFGSRLDALGRTVGIAEHGISTMVSGLVLMTPVVGQLTIGLALLASTVRIVLELYRSFYTAFRTVASLFRGLGTALGFGGLGRELREWYARSGIQARLDALVRGIRSIWDASTRLLSVVWRGFRDVLARMVIGFFGRAIGTVTGTAVGAGLGAGLGALLGGLVNRIISAFTGLVAGATMLGSKLGTVVSTLGGLAGALAAPAVALPLTIAGVLAAGGKLAEWMGVTSERIRFVADDIRSGGGQLGASILNVAAGMWDFGDSIKAWLSENVPVVGRGLGELAQGLVHGASMLVVGFGLLVGRLESGGAWVLDRLREAGGWLRESILGMGSRLAEGLGWLRDRLLEAGRSAWEALTAAGQWLAGALRSVGERLTAGIAWVAEGLRNLLGQAVAGLGNLWERLTGGLRQFGESLASGLGGVLEGLRNAFAGGLAGFSEAVAGLLGRVGSLLAASTGNPETLVGGTNPWTMDGLFRSMLAALQAIRYELEGLRQDARRYQPSVTIRVDERGRVTRYG